MDIPNIPQNLDNWNMDVIDSLLGISTIESETLECKREIKPTSLPKHICAMANVHGGFILVGLGEKMNGGKKSGYEKIGLDFDEDEINQRVSNARHEIEPTPMVKLKCILDGAKTYAIINIPEEKSKKPFFVKNGGCHIRVGSSSFPASRSIVMNLFEGLEEKKNLLSLVASLKILKAELGDTLAYIKSIHPANQTRPAQVDMGFVMADVTKNQAFLEDNDLFADISNNQVTGGILKVIQTIRKSNAQIEAYNSTQDPSQKREMLKLLTAEYHVLSKDLDAVPSIIDNVISACQNTIDEYE